VLLLFKALRLALASAEGLSGLAEPMPPRKEECVDLLPRLRRTLVDALVSAFPTYSRLHLVFTRWIKTPLSIYGGAEAQLDVLYDSIIDLPVTRSAGRVRLRRHAAESREPGPVRADHDRAAALPVLRAATKPDIVPGHQLTTALPGRSAVIHVTYFWRCRSVVSAVGNGTGRPIRSPGLEAL